MEIMLIGYGKMGHIIETVARERGHSIGCIIDKEDDWQTAKDDCQVAIDFSIPSIVKNNIRKCFDLNLPIVVGTTGWAEDFEQLKDYCLKNNKSLFHSSNFSLGVFLFNKISVYAAQILSNYNQYSPHIKETHHKYKLDKPSGTAVTLAQNLVPYYPKVEIESVREGDVFGIHEINYRSVADEISLRHTANSRAGFALGAVVAAEFLCGKTGVFSMDDLM
ncbi:MAG: 4-hydroxy-tetrahydrodipicolinate reductase [Bacteroidales bacterium]|jgi:4-hydroxy-tetrahydrodipicolinate reductase|nr:4-hydroxy-tetrahydrodipicolinate reductase [Bacteroidales bacterium]